MSYTLYKSNGSKFLIIQDGTVDTTTDLTFVGKNYTGYGTQVNENFVKLLENFANNKSPKVPVVGQLWFDTSDKRLKLYDGSRFKFMGVINYGATAPVRMNAGDLHFDTDNSLYAYNGTTWIKIGPTTIPNFQSSEGGGLPTTTILGNDSLPYNIVKIAVSGTTATVISNGPIFQPRGDQDITASFPRIYPGITLRGADPITGVSSTSTNGGKYLLWGTAASSLSLVNANGTISSASNFVKALDLQNGVSYQITSLNDTGITVGNQRVIQMHVTSSTVGNVSVIGGSRLLLNVNGIAGTYTNVISLEGSSSLGILPNASYPVALGSTATGRRFSNLYVNTVTAAFLTSTNIFSTVITATTFNVATISASSSIQINGSNVWTAASLTNNNQLSNGANYLTSSTLGTYGVTSITGTANEVTASPSKGAVTIGLPNSVRITNSLTAATVYGNTVYSNGFECLTSDTLNIPASGIQAVLGTTNETDVTVVNSGTIRVGLVSAVSGLTSLSANALYDSADRVLTTATITTATNLGLKFTITGATASLGGTLTVVSGGTGLTSYSIGDLLYASAPTTIGKLASVASGNVVISNGVNTLPTWGKVGLTTHTTGTLGVGNGGSGAATFTAGYLKASGTTAFTTTATIPGADVSGNISGNSADITGYKPLRNITSGYTGGSKVSVSSTAPTSPTQGDMWLDISGGTGYSQSLGTAGWTKLPNGILIQWGSASALANDSSGPFNFPTAFTGAVYRIYGTCSTGNSGATNGNKVGATIVSTTQYRVYSDDNAETVDWLAIGTY